MVGKRRPGRFTLKNEREVNAMAANGATASEIAAKAGEICLRARL
jgi:hypothetical protein